MLVAALARTAMYNGFCLDCSCLAACFSSIQKRISALMLFCTQKTVTGSTVIRLFFFSVQKCPDFGFFELFFSR